MWLQNFIRLSISRVWGWVDNELVLQDKLLASVLPGAGCSQGSGPVWQQLLGAGQRHGDKWEGQQVVIPVQLRQRVHKARQGKICLPGVVVKGNFWSIRPKVHTSPRVPEGQGLFAGRYVKTHEQLANGVDVKNVRNIGETSGLTELALTWRKKMWDFISQIHESVFRNQSDSNT